MLLPPSRFLRSHILITIFSLVSFTSIPMRPQQARLSELPLQFICCEGVPGRLLCSACFQRGARAREVQRPCINREHCTYANISVIVNILTYTHTHTHTLSLSLSLSLFRSHSPLFKIFTLEYALWILCSPFRSVVKDDRLGLMRLQFWSDMLQQVYTSLPPLSSLFLLCQPRISLSAPLSACLYFDLYCPLSFLKRQTISCLSSLRMHCLCHTSLFASLRLYSYPF